MTLVEEYLAHCAECREARRPVPYFLDFLVWRQINRLLSKPPWRA